MNENSTDRLFRRFAEDGDVAALAAVFDRLAPDLRRLARRLVRDPNRADDLVQEAFLTAIETPEAVEPTRPVGPWLVGVLVNRAREVRRREARVLEPERLGERSTTPPSAQVEERELALAVQRGLEVLTPGERDAVVGRLFQGQGGRELAERLGISSGALRVRLHRGLARLRAALPASLALGLAGWLGLSRGLAPVRARVLEAAAARGGLTLAGTRAVTAGTGAWLVSKAWTLGALAVAAAVVVVSTWNANEEAGALPLAQTEPALGNPDGARLAVASRGAETARRPIDGEAAGLAAPGPVAHLLRLAVVDDADERPCPGLEVVARLTEGGVDLERRVVTDDDGRGSIALAPDARVDRLEVQPGPATGHARRWLRQAASELEDEIELRVGRGGKLAGRVVDPEGRPVADAIVHGWCADRAEGAPHRTAAVGPGGAFELEALGPDFVVEARAPGRAPRGALTGTLGADAQARGFELVVAREASIEGRVIDRTGAAVPDARVWCDYSYGSISNSWNVTDHPDVFLLSGCRARTVTDEAGRFRLAGVTGRSVRVRVERAPFLRQYLDCAPDGDSVEIVLDRGLALEGEVFDSAGRPAAGARVRYGPYYGNVQTAPSETIADEVGRFRLQGFREEADGTPPYLVVLHAGHAVHVEQPVRPDRERGEPVSLRLELARAVRGRVLDDAGAGVPGVPVWLEGARELDPGYSHSRRSTWEWEAGVADAVTDADGRFAFESLYAGAFTVHVPAPWDRLEEFTAVAEADGDPVEIVLMRDRADRARLAGRVVDARSGAPVTDFTISLGRRHGAVILGEPREFHDPEGRFEFEAEPGEVHLSLGAEGYAGLALPPRELVIGAQEQDFELWPAASLSFRLVDGNGTPIERAQVSFRDPEGERARVAYAGGLGSVVYVRTGRGTAHGLPARPLTAVVEWGVDVAEFPIDLTLAPTEEVEFLLEPTPTRSVVLHALVLAEGVAEPGARARFGRIVATKDAAAWQEWNASGEIGFPTHPFTLEIRELDGQRRAIVEVTPTEGGAFAAETTVIHRSGSVGQEAEEPYPTFRVQGLPARELELVVRGAGYRESSRALFLGPSTAGDASELLVPLRRE